MSKLSIKRYVLYFALGLFISWTLAYLCFAFVLAELNPFKWEQSIRSGYVFAMVSILILSVPISQLIKLELDE